MTADSDDDIEALKAIGHICAETLRNMMQAVRPGMTTLELDAHGRRLLESAGAHSAPQVAYNYPGTTCISVSPVIAHGIPGDHVLQDGELIHIDVSAEREGYFGDTGASLTVPATAGGRSTAALAEIDPLLAATRRALAKAIGAARAGRRLNAIGKAVEQEAAHSGFHVIADLTGHGIGHSLHEAPREIWNFHNRQDHRILNEGLVLAIEPFLTTGQGRIKQAADGWSLLTADGAIAAQFEHTIVVRQGDPLILTV
jgi:methionyl aminopeptidase